MEKKKDSSSVNINDLKVIWRVIARNWFVPLIILPICYIIGYFYIYKLTNVFQASVELLKSNDTYYKENVITDQEFYGGGQSYIDNSNEIRVIKSFDLMKETVRRLQNQLQVSYYLVGRVRTTEQFSGTPFSIQVRNINPNLQESKIGFKIKNANQYELKFFNSNGSETIKTGFFNKDFVDVDFNLNVTKSPSINVNTINQLNELNYEIVIHDVTNLIYQYQQSLDVQNPEFTNVLVITLNDILPERAVLILDTLSKVYMSKSLISRFDINERTINYIDKQLEEVSSSLKETEDTMENYKQQKSILDMDFEKNDLLQKLSAFDNKKSQLNLKIDAINDLEKYIIEDKDPQFLPPNVYLVDDDAFLTKSVNELYGTQISLNVLLKSSKEDNPNIIETKQSLKALKQNILVYINNTRNATKNIIENVNGEINSYVSDIRAVPEKQRGILNIQRKVSVNEGLYNFLLQRRANTKISRATIVSDIKVIDSSRNLGVVSPDKNKIMSSFLMTGIVISIIIILLRILFFTTIQTVEELKEKTFLPVIGDLPFQKGVSNKGFIVQENPMAFISDGFRTLRTNLQYAMLDSTKKTILVTSNAPGEGKTFTTINIGAILANGGKKVVMIELDLHKPRIQKALEMNADIGISTYMVGQNTLEEIVKPTLVKNLYTILSGPIPPNPSDLILSEKLKEIINYAKENFDYVLIDTPPAGLLSDATYLMQYSDINLFIMNTKFATKQVLNLFHKLVNDNSIKNVYLVLNGIKRKRGKYYYSKYGYGYGYGYGYNTKNS